MKNAYRIVPILLYPVPLIVLWPFFWGRMFWYGTWHIGWFIHPDLLLAITLVCFYSLRFVYRKHNRELCRRRWVGIYLTTFDVISGLVLLVAAVPYCWETLTRFCVTALPTISFVAFNFGLRMVCNLKDNGKKQGGTQSSWNSHGMKLQAEKNQDFRSFR